jgi:hypothetical protein
VIPFQIDFFPATGDSPDESVLTEFPALPRFGSRVCFNDTDREIILMGEVFDTIFVDEDGETSIVVSVRKPA